MTGERHYSVFSPTVYTGPSVMALEPPDVWACWALVKASSKREAIRLAIRLPDFREWVEYQRRHGCNPFTGVKAEETLCEHGACWGCAEDGCPECLAEADARLAVELGA